MTGGDFCCGIPKDLMRKQSQKKVPVVQEESTSHLSDIRAIGASQDPTLQNVLSGVTPYQNPCSGT